MDGTNKTPKSTTQNDGVKEQAKAAVASAKEQAKDEVNARASQTQEDIADEVSGTSDALRKAASEVRDGSPQGTAFSYAAERLADVSDSIRNQDAGQVFDTVTQYARRHPIAFLGGAAALGMVAARFAKSSAPAQHASVDRPTPSTADPVMTPERSEPQAQPATKSGYSHG